jgi:hypothetical protein
MFNYVKFVATKKDMTTNFFFTPLFCCCFWIRDPGWVKIRIRDKHPGSATLTAGSYGKMFAEANCCAAERAPRVHRVLVAQPPQARLAEDVPARISLKNTIIILKNEFLTGRRVQFRPVFRTSSVSFRASRIRILPSTKKNFRTCISIVLTN